MAMYQYQEPSNEVHQYHAGAAADGNPTPLSSSPRTVGMASIYPPASSAAVDSCLQRNYDRAIDCLLHCERIIHALQGQLDSKDGQIEELEEKIVEMSLELASSKAIEDEHRMLKRRVSEGLAETEGLAADASCGVDVDRRGSSPSLSPRGDARDNEEEPPPSRPSSEAEAEPPKRRVSRASSASLNSLVAAAGLGLSRFRQRASWSVDDDPANPDSSLGDGSGESRGSMSWLLGQARPAVGRASSVSDLRRSGRLKNGPNVSCKEGHRRRATDFSMDAPPMARASDDGIGSALALEFPSTRRADCGRRSSYAEGEARMSRQHAAASNIGQVLRGTNGTDLEDDDGSAAGGDKRHPRRGSASSSRSCISGVVFPVSSDDCLEGLGEGGRRGSGKLGGRFSADGGGVSDGNNANEEWPGFR